LKNRYVFGAMLVHEGLVDGQVHGINRSYPDAIRPVLRVIPRRKGVKNVSGVYLMVLKNQSLLFADPTVNITPSSEDLAEIAILAAEMAGFFDLVPRVAMISFSDFGTSAHPDAQRVREAVSMARKRAPELMIDGEMQADTAVVGEILAKVYPFSRLDGPANVLIFPELAAANVAYKLLSRLGGAKAVGPLLMGVSKPFNVLHRDSDMENVVHVIAITVAQAQDGVRSSKKGRPAGHVFGRYPFLLDRRILCGQKIVYHKKPEIGLDLRMVVFEAQDSGFSGKYGIRFVPHGHHVTLPVSVIATQGTPADILGVHLGQIFKMAVIDGSGHFVPSMACHISAPPARSIGK
jgi:phosphate acetyltransferase